MIRLTLPVPPSANKYWRTVVIKGQGRVLLSSEARFYRAAIQRFGRKAELRPLDGPLAFSVWWYRAIKSGDLSNRIKQLEDALQGVAMHDDKQVVESHAYRREAPDRPRVEVEIRQVVDEPLLEGSHP